MKVSPTGVYFIGECDIQTSVCTALVPAPITAVRAAILGGQVNVCRACLEQMIRSGQWEVDGARIRRVADILWSDADSHPALAIECKLAPAGRGLDLEMRAVQVRRNLLAHAGLPMAPFFMLAYYPVVAFVWSNSPEKPLDAAPDVRVDLTEELRDVEFVETGSDYENAEKALLDWTRRLFQIVSEQSDSGQLEPRYEWILTSGLLNAIRGGQVAEHAVV